METLKKVRKIKLIIFALLLYLCANLTQITVKADLIEPESGAHGSGSYQLNKNENDYRFYTEYFVKADTNKNTKSAGIDRKTSIKVYAKAGETILFGSSVFNSQIDEGNNFVEYETGSDIVITKPDGNSKLSFDVLDYSADYPNGCGYIKTPTQEMYGPMVNESDRGYPETYYVPLRYDIPEGEGGIYTFEFHSITGYNPNNVPSGEKYHPSPKKTKDPWEQGNNSVAAWDITVLGLKEQESQDAQDIWEVKEGRAWADYLALTSAETTTNNTPVAADLNVHVLSHDGYVYKVDFEQTIPYGFIFFANNTGFMTPVADENDNSGKVSYRPIYHSFYDKTNDLDNMNANENIYLHKPFEPDDLDAGLETYKIFFNRPSDDLKEIGIKTNPDNNVELTDLKFEGIENNIARTGQGGYFTFNSTNEAMVTIRLDLRKAIFDSEDTIASYDGSGIVEITAPAKTGENRFYWDGKDTDGVSLPAGIYGNNNVVLSSEVKRGELHFPVIDMEGLNGGLRIKRLNGDGADDENNTELYNLYYNNNPLVYGIIEGEDYINRRVTVSGYDVLSDGTKSYKTDSGKFFKDIGRSSISTLVKDDKNYLALKFFDSSYDSLSPERKAIIDAEFGSEHDTFHFEPVDSRSTSMKFSYEKYEGGGNKSGIDAWTYYSQGIHSSLISFALMDTEERGLIRGQIFYDTNKDSKYDANNGDYLLPNVKVRLIDSNGKPLVHEESLPCFDETGHFIYNEDGSVKHELKSVTFEQTTDSQGYYRFLGVPYSKNSETTYYVQVLLSDVQSEVLRYTCTTSEKVKQLLIANDNSKFLDDEIIIDHDSYGSDGNKIVPTTDINKIYRHKYDRDTTTNDTVFDFDNAQSITIAGVVNDTDVYVEEFKKIGYCTTVPPDHQKNYRINKHWGVDSQGNETHKIDDGLIVELWVWNDAQVEEENARELSRRTGALIDTQVLDELNGWTYTWNNLDDRLQYYVLEYYTKKKPNGEIIYNDKEEPRKVLIGGTMPIFGAESSVPQKGIYGFETSLGDYPETIPDPNDSTKTRIPIQKFGENRTKTHTNSITKKEKLESVDNNARQYNVTYELSVEGDTNIIDLTNSQVFDDRTYYVWLDHKAVLPDMIAKTFVENGSKESHAVTLERDKQLSDNEYSIKGLSISSVDAASSNTEGNATKAFRITEDGTSAFFTATNQGNYKTGTGTRTYGVKYVEDSATKKPVSITTNKSGELVLSGDNNVKVENNPAYIVYTWYMTIHVYNVIPDGVFEYDPNGGEIKLEEALPPGRNLIWNLSKDSSNANLITYTNDDDRSGGILQNDTYRVPLYKAAENPNMGSCADLVGIAYAGSSPDVDVKELIFEDTYDSRYGAENAHHDNGDGVAVAQGSGGFVTATLNTTRITRINRVQDHANYAEVTFTPNNQSNARSSELGEDVFYYKIVVFAEDNTYQYAKYDEISASDGVEMYTYFTMKPIKTSPDNTDKPNNNSGEPTKTIIVNSNNDINAEITGSTPVVIWNIPVDTEAKPKEDELDSNVRAGKMSPKTGDESNVLLWTILIVLGFALIILGLHDRKIRR